MQREMDEDIIYNTLVRYQKYCFQLKVNPEVYTTRLDRKIPSELHEARDRRLRY